MKATGIVRNLDSLGRIVIPMELRRTLGITEGDPIEIYTDGDSIILKRYVQGCFICPESDPSKLQSFHSKLICEDCIKSIVDNFDKLVKPINS
ncbi:MULTISPECIES: AbrB/MazE/SpoVT family DNA-binding domain-containing protein [Paenibacillus]|uniref:Transcriptional regulator, AbrB family n=1 Tax=Paenibacillus lactis 154 TaxID=743719 RepID=G4HEG5_9BACL|nr:MULTISPECIES: AbrB/MazE/SpoVT family DNA-binding domain-containing protein [Paenibacillus]EHB65234.1 transcriptional regulator, AbrB family [Paenibacillus lactis 154]